MSLLITLLFLQFPALLITEVERNPIGFESASPGGLSHEYIEFLQSHSAPLPVDQLLLTDGITIDSLLPWDLAATPISGCRSADTLYPGDRVLLLDRDYTHRAQPYDIADGTLILTTNHRSLCGGLSGNDGFALLYNDAPVALFPPTAQYEHGTKLIAEGYTEADSSAISRRSLLDSSYTNAPQSPGTIAGLTGTLYREQHLARRDSTIIATIQHYDFTGNPHRWKLSSSQESYKGTLPSEPVVLPLSLPLTEALLTYDDSLVDTLDISTLWLPDSALRISEIAPRAPQEWLELYNGSTLTISLDACTLAIGNDTIPLPTYALRAGARLVLGEGYPEELGLDSIAFLDIGTISLGNYEDTVVLLTPAAPLQYSWDKDTLPDWNNESLTSHKGALQLTTPTPGTAAHQQELDTLRRLVALPRLFKPAESPLSISLTQPPFEESTLYLYAFDGSEIYQWTLRGTGTIRWNGRDKHGRRAARGPIILIAEGEQTLRTEIVLWSK